jgi:hypothetical protein
VPFIIGALASTKTMPSPRKGAPGTPCRQCKYMVSAFAMREPVALSGQALCNGRVAAEILGRFFIVPTSPCLTFLGEPGTTLQAGNAGKHPSRP